MASAGSRTLVSTNRKPAPRRPASPRRHGTKSRASRAQVTILIVSSLVICGLVGATFVSLTLTDIFGDLFVSDTDRDNFVDPNRDIIAAQETIVAQNPDSLEDILLLANMFGNTGRLPDAIPLYERALELAPNDVDARVSFARALADGGLVADAELQFMRALDINPGEQQAHYYLAELYMTSNPVRSEEAIVHYWRVIEIDPGTLIGERAQTRLDSLGSTSPPASPIATPEATPA